MQSYDLLIVGAGPVGLYAAFYAGMRGLSVAIIESFDKVGGQPQNLYPEKTIYDIAGIPAISGTDLSQNLLEQLHRIDYELFTGEQVEKIEALEANFLVATHSFDKMVKNTRQAKAILLTTGAGLISPRKIGVAREDEFYEKGKLSYFIQSMESFRNQKVAILGGGDSALDWALMLEKIADEVHLIHRRTAFRAHEMTVELVANSSVDIHVPYTVSALTDAGLEIQLVKSEQKEHVNVDKILVNYGFLTNQMDLVENLETNRMGRIFVDREMHTNLPGIYAAGDNVDYQGKLPLIAVGFGEAVTAVNAITKDIDFQHGLRKGHSSTLFGA